MDGLDDVIFVTPESSKCLGCAKEGHLMRSRPERETQNDSTVEKDAEERNKESDKTERALVVGREEQEKENKSGQGGGEGKC